LLLVDEDMRILLLKTKNCFLYRYRIQWCIHFGTSSHYESEFNRVHLLFCDFFIYSSNLCTTEIQSFM